jgi:hypothetical protein
MHYEPPNTTAGHPLTLRFIYGTSAYQPVDDPQSWPHPNGPELTFDAMTALAAKLAYLQTTVLELKQGLEPADDDSGLVPILEDEGMYEVRYAVPEALPAQIDAYLEKAAELLAARKGKAAGAQLRVAETLVRLVLGWGQGETRAMVAGASGLEAGETAAVVIKTDVEINSDGCEEIKRVTHWLEQ